MDATQDVVCQGLQHGGLTEPQYGTILRPGEFAGQQEELVTQLGRVRRCQDSCKQSRWKAVT